MILSDFQIKNLCKPTLHNEYKPMIENFVDRQVNKEGETKIVSYGLSSYGYDLRCSRSFKLFRPNTYKALSVLDPSCFDTDAYEVINDDEIIIPPLGFLLTNSMEKFNMPDDVTGLVTGKSTYARLGINCICTPLEAGWSGYLTIELFNSSPRHVVVRSGQGICQVLFLKGDKCATTYADRGGKYMNQPAEPVDAKL